MFNIPLAKDEFLFIVARAVKQKAIVTVATMIPTSPIFKKHLFIRISSWLGLSWRDTSLMQNKKVKGSRGNL